MKLKHLTVAASIAVAVSCNSGTNSNEVDTTIDNTQMTDTSAMMHDTMGMMMHDTSMMHMQTCVVMENDKMMVMENGKTMDMKEMMTMDNGTKVMADGNYTTADGKTAKLKNGECIMKDGSLTTMGKMPM